MMKRKRLLISLGLVLVGALFFSSVPALAGENPGQGKSLAEARKALEQQLTSVPGFVGIAHSEERGEITVFVENEQARGIAPDRFEGHPVRKEVTGRIQALSTQVAEPITSSQATTVSRLGKVRPLVGGISLSAYVEDQSWAGTLGMVTYDGKLLSNAHVIAMDLGNNFLPKETPVIQPGSYDGGTLTDHQVGTLEDYIPIQFGEQVGRSPNWRFPATNYADAAIATLEVEGVSGEQFGNYQVEGWTVVSEGDIVRKSGRTTGVTTGEVVDTNASVAVWYGTKPAYFVDQIAVAQENWSFAAPGDSGSAADKGGEFVGLVFAGSETHMFINKASYIIAGLGIAVEPVEPPPAYAVEITPASQSASGAPGDTVTYTFTIANTGAEGDSYDLATDSTWTFSVSSSSVSVQAGESVTVTISHVIPEDVADGASDIGTLTATSTTVGTISSSATFTTTAQIVTEAETISIKPVEWWTIGNNRHLRLKLTLIDEEENAVSGATVKATLTHQEKGPWSFSGTTNGDGEVTFGLNNAPNGEYELTVNTVTHDTLEWDGMHPENNTFKK